jgi:hypothetical protein
MVSEQDGKGDCWGTAACSTGIFRKVVPLSDDQVYSPAATLPPRFVLQRHREPTERIGSGAGVRWARIGPLRL